MCIKYCTQAGFLPPNMRLKIVFYKKNSYLYYCLQMPRVSPESCWNIWLGELRRPLEKLIKEFLVAAVEDGLLRGVVHVEDLEEDAEAEGHQDEDVHLDPLLHGGGERLQGGHAPLVDLGSEIELGFSGEGNR